MSILFEGVSHAYDAEARGLALSDVTFEIATGQFCCLVGHTGSGKSTAASLACGALVPTQGRISVNGVPTADKPGRRHARRTVGLVMQYPEYQLFAPSVLEDVAFGPRNFGQTKTQAEAAARQALQLVGLDPDAVGGVSPFDLSGGQRRLAAMAGILACQPTHLVLDEPMAGLDPRGRREVMGVLRRLHADGTTIVMVSHAMDDVAQLAQQVLVLAHGKLVDQGTPGQVFSHTEVLHEAGLEEPQALACAKRLQARGLSFGDGLPLTLDALAAAILAQQSGCDASECEAPCASHMPASDAATRPASASSSGAVMP